MLPYASGSPQQASLCETFPAVTLGREPRTASVEPGCAKITRSVATGDDFCTFTPRSSGFQNPTTSTRVGKSRECGTSNDSLSDRFEFSGRQSQALL